MKLQGQYHLTQTERKQIKLGLAAVTPEVGAAWKNKTGSKIYEITGVEGATLTLVVKTKGKDDYGRLRWRTQKATVTY